MKLIKTSLTPPICAISVVFAAVMSMNAAVVCYDSHATGANDGTSWADAFTDLQAAINAAGNGGEVRVKQGVHYPVASAATSITIGNVKLIGGYTGSGDERSTDRRLTVFTGDFNKNDQYVDKDGNVIGPVFDYEKGEFIDFRVPTEAEQYWKWDDSKRSDNVKTLFTVDRSAVADYTQVIEGLTLTGCGSGGTSYGPVYSAADNLTGAFACYAVITNCDIIGCYVAGANGAGLIAVANASKILDCGFYGNYGCQIVYEMASTDLSDPAQRVATIKGCTFSHAYGAYRNIRSIGICAFYNKKVNNVNYCGIFDVLDCTFDYFYGGDVGGTGGQGFVLGCHTGSFRTIDNCKFRHIRFDNRTGTGASSLRIIYNNGTYGSATMSNCEISDCVATSEYPLDYMVYVDAINNCVVRNNSYVTDATATTVGFVYGSAISGLTVSNNLVVGNASGLATVVSGQGISALRDNVIIGNCVTNVGAGKASIVNCRINSENNVRVEDNLVVNENGSEVSLLADLGSTGLHERLAVVNNSLIGGMTASKLLASAPGCKMLNCMVAKNHQKGYGEQAVAATFYRSGNDSWIISSTFYGNDAPVEVHTYANDAKFQRLHLNSSVLARDADAPAYTPYVLLIGEKGSSDIYYKGITTYRSYFGGLANDCGFITYPGASSAGELYVDAPVFSPTLLRSADGFPYFVMRSPTPYRHKEPGHKLYAATNGDIVFWFADKNWWQKANGGLTSSANTKYADSLSGTEVACLDYSGEERPEGWVVIGAVQELEKPGLMLLVR